MKFVFFFLVLLSVIYEGYSEYYVGNPDNTAKIVRPCPTYDLNCIRKYFRDHASCKISFGPAPDPLIRPELSYYFSRVNVTVTILRNRISGINGRIEEFYVNEDTNEMVLAVGFQNLNLTTDLAYFKFHRRAKEPVVTTAPASVLYLSAIITSVFPMTDDLQLDKAEATVFANDATPVTIVGPSASESSDPQVQATIAEFLSKLSINTQELFLTDAFYYINAYIQYNICDFGLLVA